MPWKQLLRMGKIKPSTEAIDMLMSMGEQMVTRAKAKLLSIVEQDLYWPTLTPTQAAIMLYGIAPPTPDETIKLVEDIFVKKEKLLEVKYVNTLKKIRKYYKAIEHGEMKDITGQEVQDLLVEAEEYFKRIKELFAEIEQRKEKERIVEACETIITIIRDILRLHGIKDVKQEDIPRLFTSELVNKGRMPEKQLRILKLILESREKYEKDQLTKAEVEGTRKEASQLIKSLVEYIQRTRGSEIERTKIRVKHGEKFGEVILLGKTAFIVHDLDSTDQEISKADIKPNGSLGTTSKSNMIELEKAIAEVEVPEKAFIKAPIFEDLKKIFGKEVEILVHY